MIIIRLSGGLGNQMFQYAAAKALALTHQTELIVDVTNLKIKKIGFTPREFELSIFENELFKYLSESDKVNILEEELSFVQKALNKFMGKQACKYYRQPSFKFNENFLELEGENYLIGYFQSEKYFTNFEKEIRKTFQFPKKISEKNKQLCSEILSNNSVSVHVRRGDYIKYASNLKHHGICSLEYYQNAMELVSQKVEKPVFYFFSDDTDWVKKNIKGDYPIRHVEHNHGNQSFEDMRLMSHCKHHVIANSSFSWWGAWLNPNVNKLVIAPKPWFNNVEKEKETTDLIPKKWICLRK